MSSWLVSPPKFLVFWQWNDLCSTKHPVIRQDSPFSPKRESLGWGTSRDYWQSFKLDVAGEWDNSRFVPGQVWDDMQRLEGWDSIESLLPMALRSAGWSRSSFQSCRDEPGTHLVTEANSKTLGKYFKGIKRGSSGKAVLPTAQLRCFYTNECSMSDKQEELEATLLLESYDLVALIETWWNESRDWTAPFNGCS